MSTPLTVMIDWLEFTVKNVELEALITEVLHLPVTDFTELETGRYGYNAQLKWAGGDLAILYNEFMNDDDETVEAVADPMGIHVVVTGKGCRFYEAVNPLPELIIRLADLELIHKVTRLDLALDDLDSQFISYDRFQAAAIAGDFTSRWNKWRETIERRTSDNGYVGRTMYFGSPTSELFCRVYDKTLEQQASEHDVPAHWTRLELVYRKERANQLATKMRETQDVGLLLRKTLNHYMRFLSHDTHDVNKARWQTADWWDALIGAVGTLQLTTEASTKTIEEIETWVVKQIGPTLATLMKAHSGELKWFINALYAGEGRMKQKHWDAIAQFTN